MHKEVRLIFVCQALSTQDPILADVSTRLKKLAAHALIVSVDVICLDNDNVQASDIGKNVCIHSLRNGPQNRINTLIRFYRSLLKILSSGQDYTLYSYMSARYPLLVWPLRPFFNLQTVAWYGHTKASLIGKFSLRHCTDKWLTSNQSMMVFPSENVRFVGQGIDQDKFYPLDSEKIYDIVTVGRITPIKKLDMLLSALKICRDDFGKTYRLAIVGEPYTESDKDHQQQLLRLLEKSRLTEMVDFLGSVPHSDLNAVLNRARVFAFPVPGGIGKGCLEGMACGLPVVIATPGAADFFGEYLSSQFLCEDNPESFAESLVRLLEASETATTQLRGEILRFVQANCTLDAFIDRVVDAITEQRKPCALLLSASTSLSDGWGNYTRSLAEALKEQGLDVEIWTETVNKPSSLLRFRRYVKATKPDVVLVCSETLAWMCFGLSQRVILTVHGTYGLTEQHGPLWRRAFFWLVRRQADALIAVSSFTAHKLPAALQNRTVVIPNAVRLNDGDESFELPDWEGSPRVLSVGALKPRKGYKHLLRGFKIFVEKHPKAQLRIIGDGIDSSYGRELRNLVDQLDLSRYVRFMGKVSRSELLGHYRKCDLFALTTTTDSSGHFDGFGLVYLEANIFGKPVVGNKASGAVSAISDGVSGVLCDADEPLEVFNAMEKAHSLSKEVIIDWVQGQSWSKRIPSYKRVLLGEQELE